MRPSDSVANRALLAGAALVLAACGTAAVPAASSIIDTVAVGLPPMTTLASIVTTGDATAVAKREPTTTMRAETFDPVAYVNGLEYGWTFDAPTMEAFRVVALHRGWTQAAIDRWWAFAHNVFMREGVGCWNARGLDVFAVGSCTELVRYGGREDSGHAQLTSALWGRNGELCKLEGYCSGEQVRSSPWASMDSAVATFEIYGRYPWCDYEGVPIGWHDCTLIGKNERPLP